MNTKQKRDSPAVREWNTKLALLIMLKGENYLIACVAL